MRKSYKYVSNLLHIVSRDLTIYCSSVKSAKDVKITSHDFDLN